MKEILLQNVFLPPDSDFSLPSVAAAIGVPAGALSSVRLIKKSVDARDKTALRFCCSFAVVTDRKLPARFSPKPWQETLYLWKRSARKPAVRPVVVGFGPAGMFAALTLARAGLCPLVLERGADADRRKAAVDRFFAGGALDPAANVQFGEGGAGTFSDGKLATGIKDPRCRTVIEQLVHFGADPALLTDAKPHVGTDVLIGVVKALRREVESLGGEVRFGARLTALTVKNGAVAGIVFEQDGSSFELPAEAVVLAIGHSARDTFTYLYEAGFPMASKPFAVGARIEHRQPWIDRAQYGSFAGHPALGAADYRLATHLADGRGVYTFCMCPGGVVVNASHEPDGVVTNGMSYRARDGKNGNAALLVGVDSRDFGDGVLDGMYFQRTIEQAAYRLAGGHRVTCQTVGDFLAGRASSGAGDVAPTVCPAPRFGDLREILPAFVTEALGEGIRRFDRLLPGFADGGALLTGPETRSSSPIRILRNDRLQSPVAGLYPCGEGAGYAGGITSAAVDGIRVAECILG